MTNKEETHSCKKNYDKDVEIRHEKINKEQWSWVVEQSGIEQRLKLSLS